MSSLDSSLTETLERKPAAIDPPRYVVPLQINGKEIVTLQKFPVTNPATGKIIHEASSASIEDANAAVEAAQQPSPPGPMCDHPQSVTYFSERQIFWNVGVLNLRSICRKRLGRMGSGLRALIYPLRPRDRGMLLGGSPRFRAPFLCWEVVIRQHLF